MSSVYDSLSKDTAAAADSLSAMMGKERKIYKSCNYLRKSSMITSSDRRKMVDWCYNVVDTCQFDRETVANGMEMVDRYLSKSSSQTEEYLNDHTKYQLLSMTALYIANKIHDPVAFSSDLFAEISNGLYSKDDIETMEWVILQGLEFRVYAPTSIQMALHILSLVLPLVNLEESTWDSILDKVRFGTEFSVRGYFFSTQRPSTTAMAAILNALDQVDCRDCQEVLRALILIEETFSFASGREIFAAMKRLTCLVESDGHIEDMCDTESSSKFEDSSDCSDAQITPSNSISISNNSSPRTGTCYQQESDGLRELCSFLWQ